MGGRTVRETILHRTLAYLVDYGYALVVARATIWSIVLFRRFHRVEPGLIVLDVIELGPSRSSALSGPPMRDSAGAR
jgi:uncharacterized membrane protein YeiH